HQFIRRKGKPSVGISDIRSLGCVKSKEYYSICRSLQIRIQMEYLLNEENISPHRDLGNLDRLIAPLLEESELAYIPFLERIVPDLGARLAYLGFAYEAVHFQKLAILTERLAGRFEAVSYERLAFYQILIGDMQGAEDTLIFASKSLKSVSIAKNSLLLKSGMLAYVRKDYKQSLASMLELNLKFWGKTLRNPITDEALSTYDARELIALSLSKARNPALAVQALTKLKTDKPDEEDLFIKLRAAQIVFKDRPALAEKLTDDIIYMAQSNGWKRVEYAATLLNGYTLIVNKKYRRAVIQFTKCYGILGNAENSYASEWMRLSGMVTARVLAREKGKHSQSYKVLLANIRKGNFSTDYLSMKMYLDPRFGLEEFTRQAAQYFVNLRDYESLFLLVNHASGLNQKIPVSQMRSTLQIPYVHSRMKIWKGFRPVLDNVYFKSSFSSVREKEAANLRKLDIPDLESFKKLENPFLAILPYNDQLFAFSYQPSRGEKYRWTLQVFSGNEYKTGGYYSKLLSSFPFLEGTDMFQIYFNAQGADLYQHLKRLQMKAPFHMFASFRLANYSSKPMDIVTPDCGKKESEFTRLGTEYFEGMKAFDSDERVQIWKFPEKDAREGGLEGYTWKCDSRNRVSFYRMQRRLDHRMVPGTLIFPAGTLNDSTPENLGGLYLEWTDYWLKKGAGSVYFVDKIQDNDTAMNNVIKSVSKGDGDSLSLIGILNELKNSGRTHAVVTKTMR
ncbi:MAG TPA: hypothetical protein PKN56_25735, partial [Leptospiraceae bacterium]|nr:hypothetical protein [Leptospiraceae bacterium]